MVITTGFLTAGPVMISHLITCFFSLTSSNRNRVPLANPQIKIHDSKRCPNSKEKKAGLAIAGRVLI